MVKVDLITGFLGSGKTTFLKKYVKYFLDEGKRIGIIENDFGAVNVDMMLLQDIMGDNCQIEMISGECDKDCHARRFKTKLIAMGMLGFDRVVVEPSGIFDVDEFFDIIREEPLDRWYETGNVITIMDSKIQDDFSKESASLMAAQLACAGQVILSKSQYANEDDINNTINKLAKICSDFECNKEFYIESQINDIRKILDNDNACIVVTKPWDELTDEDFKKISLRGYTTCSVKKMWFEQDDVYDSIYFMNLRISLDEIKRRINMTINDESYGHVFRIKGFAKDENEGWVQINATYENIHIDEIANGQEIIIIIGENLQKDAINNLWQN